MFYVFFVRYIVSADVRSGKNLLLHREVELMIAPL